MPDITFISPSNAFRWVSRPTPSALDTSTSSHPKNILKLSLVQISFLTVIWRVTGNWLSIAEQSVSKLRCLNEASKRGRLWQERALRPAPSFFSALRCGGDVLPSPYPNAEIGACWAYKESFTLLVTPALPGGWHGKASTSAFPQRGSSRDLNQTELFFVLQLLPTHTFFS